MLALRDRQGKDYITRFRLTYRPARAPTGRLRVAFLFINIPTSRVCTHVRASQATSLWLHFTATAAGYAYLVCGLHVG